MADVNIMVRLDSETRNKILTMFPEAISRALDRAKRNIDNYARSITPVSTGWKHAKYGPSGSLRDSFDSFISKGPTATIHMKWSTPYAKTADEGARPHVIFAHTPGGLIFKYKNGAWVRTMSVDHPGYAGRHFSEEMRIVGPQFVREAIISELQGLNQI